MADEKIEISREAREWVEELENMKKSTSFHMLILSRWNIRRRIVPRIIVAADADFFL